MYSLTYGLKKVSKHETFSDAFIALFDKIMAEDSVSLQILETSIWISDDDNPQIIPTFFYEAKDIAIKIGILKDCKIDEDFRKKYEQAKNIIISEVDDNKDDIETHLIICPLCLSSNTFPVKSFDNVFQCKKCKNQFMIES